MNPECGHAQTIRVRKGYTWRCRKCGTVNPGPGMLAAVFQQQVAAVSKAAAPAPRRRRASSAPALSRDPATGRFLPAAASSNGVAPPASTRPAPAATAPRRRAQLGTTQPATRSPTRRRADPEGDSNDTARKPTSSSGLRAVAGRIWHGS